MDAIICDNQTITIEDVDGVKMLKVIGGSGGGTGVNLTVPNPTGNGNAVTSISYNSSTGVLSVEKGTKFAQLKDLQELVGRVDTLEDALASGGSSSGSFKVEEDGTGNAYTSYTYANGTLTLNKETLFATASQLSTLSGTVANKADKSSVYTKTEIDKTLESYVTVDGDEMQTITGKKNFTGGLFVNNKQIKYNSDGYWELEGDLLVTGGITSFASSSGFTPSTIMDAIVCDEQTITVDVINGVKTLKVIGGVGSNNELTVDKSGSGNAFTSYTYTDGKLTLFKGTTFATANELNALSSTVDNKWTTDNTKINNWDKAFNWGNHASVGYVTSSSLTETLNDYVTVDGDEQEIKGKKNFTDGGLFVNGQQLVYNKDGYWKMEGNLLVTGGITAYSSDGKASPFLLDADTWEGITSNSATQVYSAKSVTLLKNEVKLVGEDADSALDKFDIIREELSTLTDSSLTTAIRNALLNIKKRI
jgi:hypothetical protein